MGTIEGIIDMDGFTIGKVFYCKELGMIRRGQTHATSVLFDLGLDWGQLSEKDKRSVLYVEKHIHKIPFASPSSVPVSALPQIVKEHFSGLDITVAYKGGHYERDILGKLGISSINLEDLGCPKAEQLFEKLSWLETCGQHLTPDAYQHCPKVEAEAFAMWLW